jgi:hypothetical protein
MPKKVARARQKGWLPDIAIGDTVDVHLKFTQHGKNRIPAQKWGEGRVCCPDPALGVVPWRRGGTWPPRRTVLSLAVKRRMAAVDPETAARQRNASTQEGG